jgi:hypothetical protein
MTARNACVVMAAFITPKNCFAVTGTSWDTLRKRYLALGVPQLRLGRQVPAVELAAFLEALRAEAARAQAPAQLVAAEPDQDRTEGGQERPRAANGGQRRPEEGEPVRSLADVTEAARSALRTRVGGNT